MLTRRASDQDDLFTIHTKSWNLLWKTGVTVDISSNFMHQTCGLFSHLFTAHEGKDAARHFNSSMYFLLSSILIERFIPLTMHAGGIASNSYNGGVFIDMDFWMYPGLLMLHPTLARAILEYRYYCYYCSNTHSQRIEFKGIQLHNNLQNFTIILVRNSLKFV
jgi:trehalose/maltose hydrolase-like predicted phosphorylase